MRIVIDMQGAQTESRFRGIGRYTIEFAKAVARNKGGHEILLVLNGSLNESIRHIQKSFVGLLPKRNFKVWHPLTPIRASGAGNEQRRLISTKIYNTFIKSLEPDVIHTTSLFEGYLDDSLTCVPTNHRAIQTATLYDLIPLLNPKQYFDDSPLYRDFYTEKVDQLKAADSLFAISEFSRIEAIHHLSLREEQIVNVSTGISDLTRRCGYELPDNFVRWAKNLGIEGNFVLYSGGSDERKNLVRLVRAYALLPLSVRAENALVLAGKMRDQDKQLLLKAAKEANLDASRLIFTGYVSDDHLSFLYRTCSLYVFPSWHEGFGLPPLEAMKHGAPVIASNAASIPEVVGLESALFDPFNIDSIAAKLLEGLTDEGFRDQLRIHGTHQAKKFNWDKVALSAIGTWAQLHQEGGNLLEESVGHTNHLKSPTGQLVNDLINQIRPTVKDLSHEDLIRTCFAIDLITNSASPRQIFVDVSELITNDAKTGVQRVTRSILNQLTNAPPSGFVVRPVFATLDSFGYLYTTKFGQSDSGSILVDEGTPITYRSGDIFLGLDLQHHTTNAQAQFLHGLRDHGAEVCFVVYDLLPIQFPDFWPAGQVISDLHEKWLRTISEFDRVVCISESVAIEFTDWISKNQPERSYRPRIGWFHLGGDLDNSIASHGLPADAENICRQLKELPSFLMVGTLEPRKGHEQALNAFEFLWAEGVKANLVIVGKKGWLTDSLAGRIRNHAHLGKNLFWFEGMSDEFLNSVYAASSCLLAASYGEGFGLPLIEAAHHKIPIIARDIPVFREVAGPHAYYFDSKDPAHLAACIRDWLALYRDNKHPTSNDLPWISWVESTQQLLSELTKEHETLVD